MHIEKNQSKRIFGLDAMRAVAVLLVLADHAWPSSANIKWAGTCGALGVEMFFVLSGFLIGGILLQLADTGRLGTWSGLVQFWRRRWYRTLPLYYLMLLLRLAWEFWGRDDRDILLDNLSYFLFVQNINGSWLRFFGESWSLSVEEWFYLLFPLLLWVLLRIMKQKNMAWWTAMLIFLTIPLILRTKKAFAMIHANPVFLTHSDWARVFRMGVVFRLDVLMYGVAAAFLATRHPSFWKRVICSWPLGLIFILIAILSMGFQWPLDTERMWEGQILFPCMPLGFTLLLARASLLVESRGWFAKPVSFVAVISYSLYLCHGLVISVIGEFCKIKSPIHLVPFTWPWSLIVFVISFLLATMLHYSFEKPMMNRRDQIPERAVEMQK